MKTNRERLIKAILSKQRANVADALGRRRPKLGEYITAVGVGLLINDGVPEYIPDGQVWDTEGNEYTMATLPSSPAGICFVAVRDTLEDVMQAITNREAGTH